jgi:phosphoribosylglycinamide formyltransferase-1
MKDLLEIGWFSTGRDEAAVDLLQTVAAEILSGRLGCRIRYVFSNRSPGEDEASDRFLSCVRRLGLPLLTFSSRSFKPELWRDPLTRQEWRLAFDAEVERIIRPYPVRVIVLAGYMLVLGEELCRRYPFLNLHPALPGGPTGTWQEVIWQLLLQEADQAGAMMHLVTPELDRGPAVTYFSFSLRGPGWDELWEEWRARRDRSLAFIQTHGLGAAPGPEEKLFWAVRREEARRELPLLILTLDYLSRGEIAVYPDRVVDREGRSLAGGYCLTEAVEAWIARAGG